jgi:thioredoxin-related protein
LLHRIIIESLLFLLPFLMLVSKSNFENASPFDSTSFETRQQKNTKRCIFKFEQILCTVSGRGGIELAATITNLTLRRSQL